METDRQTDKSTRWAFTAYEAQWDLFKTVPELTAEQGWQEETCPETGRKHYQGYIRTKRQCRFTQMKKAYPGVHIEVSRNWDALLNYCKKKETATEGTQVVMLGTKQMTMAQALVRLASHVTGMPEYVEDKTLAQLYTDEYWSLVRKVLADDPDSIGLYTNQMYLCAWKNTRSVWINLATKEQEAQPVGLGEAP